MNFLIEILQSFGESTVGRLWRVLVLCLNNFSLPLTSVNCGMVGLSSIPPTSFPNMFFQTLFSSLLSRANKNISSCLSWVLGKIKGVTWEKETDKKSWGGVRSSIELDFYSRMGCRCGLFYSDMGNLLTCNHFSLGWMATLWMLTLESVSWPWIAFPQPGALVVTLPVIVQ